MSDNAVLLDTAPENTRYIYVQNIHEMDELAALDADEFELLADKWHGRSRAC